jgi:hypothetical protein
MSGGRFIYFPQRIFEFNVKNSWRIDQARVFSAKQTFSRENSGELFKLEFSRRKALSPERRVFSSRWLPRGPLDAPMQKVNKT